MGEAGGQRGGLVGGAGSLLFEGWLLGDTVGVGAQLLYR